MAVQDFDDYVRILIPILNGLKEILGNRAEFILHNLSVREHSVSAVIGNITNRAVGAPATNVVTDAISKFGDNAPDMIGYRSVSKDGRVLKSSTIFIRNIDGKIIGCLCYNVDLTDFAMAENLMKSFGFQGDDNNRNIPNEVFAQDVSDIVEDIIMSEISKFPKPVPMMSRADKLMLVKILEAKDVFNVKGSTEIVAKRLGSSVFTIYNYLKEIRNTQ